jgi:hypothetical protein
MAPLWVKVELTDGTGLGNVFDIEPVPPHVSALCRAIKKELSQRLKHCDANELSIFPPTTNMNGSEVQYKADFSGFPVTTADAPLMVIAPAAQEEAGDTEGTARVRLVFVLLPFFLSFRCLFSMSLLGVLACSLANSFLT